MVRAILPCPTCGHRIVCSIRPKLDTEELAFRTPPSPDPAIRIALTATVTCEYYDGEIGGPPPGDLFTPEGSTKRHPWRSAERSASARRGGEVVRRERPTALTSDPEETVDLIPTAAAATGPSSAATEGRRCSPAGPPLTEGELFAAYRGTAVR
jgi:hypothetical protein